MYVEACSKLSPIQYNTIKTFVSCTVVDCWVEPEAQSGWDSYLQLSITNPTPLSLHHETASDTVQLISKPLKCTITIEIAARVFVYVLIFRSSFPVCCALVTWVTSNLPAAWCSLVLWDHAQPALVHCRVRTWKMLMMWWQCWDLNFLTMSWWSWCLLRHENTLTHVPLSMTQTWNLQGMYRNNNIKYRPAKIND